MGGGQNQRSLQHNLDPRPPGEQPHSHLSSSLELYFRGCSGLCLYFFLDNLFFKHQNPLQQLLQESCQGLFTGMCTVPFLFLHIGIGSGYLDQPTTNNLDAYEAQPLSLSCRHCGRSTFLALLQQGKVSTRRRPLVLENSGMPPPPARWVPTVLIALPAEGEAALAWPSCPFPLAWLRRTVPRIRG